MSQTKSYRLQLLYPYFFFLSFSFSRFCHPPSRSSRQNRGKGVSLVRPSSALHDTIPVAQLKHFGYLSTPKLYVTTDHVGRDENRPVVVGGVKQQQGRSAAERERKAADECFHNKRERKLANINHSGMKQFSPKLSRSPFSLSMMKWKKMS